MGSMEDRRGTILAVALATGGIATLAGLFLLQSLPNPLWLWLVLAASFVALEVSSVAVGDGLSASSSAMVAFTAAVVFGQDGAVLAVALMAALAVVHPDDIRLRRWRQPASNFGQLVISAAVGMSVFRLFLPAGELTTTDLPLLALGAAVSAIVYDWVNFQLVAFGVRILYPGRPIPSWIQMLSNHLSLSVLAAFGAFLGSAYVLAGAAVLPLLFPVFAVGHAGFAAYARLRDAHEAAIRGMVKAIEALDPYTRGHTDRVARFVVMMAGQLGVRGERLQRLRWVALLHDVGKVAVPSDLLRKPGALDGDEYRQVVRHMRSVEEMLGEVEFLRPMVEVIRVHHLVLDPGSALPEDLDPTVIEDARILAVADAFDAMTSTRSYRAAVTQREAFERLRAGALGSDAVEALIAAIEDAGEVFGSPDDEVSAEQERLVRDRASRA